MDQMISILRVRKIVTVPQPAANTDWTQTVPAGTAWLVKAVCASIVQGATQTPQPVLILADAAGNVFGEGVGATTAQSAATTVSYTWAPEMVQSGLIGASADVHAQAPLPCGDELYMPGGWTIATHTLGKGAATQWQAIVIYVVENTL